MNLVPDTGLGARRSILRAFLSPVGALSSGVLTLLVLITAMHKGEAVAVASYSGGLSIGAISAVLIGGGTSLVFISGSLEEQRAVRAVRVKLVLPSIVFVSVLGGWLFAQSSGLPLWGVLLGGGASAAMNLGEIESGYLRRMLRTQHVLMVDACIRLFALIGVLLGAGFGLSMFSAMLLRTVLLWLFARSDPSRVASIRLSIRASVPVAYSPGLTSTAILYSITDRTMFLLVPLAIPAEPAGFIAAMLSGQQAISGALVSGLQTVMAARVQSGAALKWMSLFDKFTVVAAIAVAGTGFALSVSMLSILNIPTENTYIVCWSLIITALPLGVLNRAIHFRMIEAKTARNAAFMLLASVSTLVVVGVFAIVLADMIVFCLGILLGEAAGTMLGIFVIVWTRMRRRRIPAHEK